jgi:hypothetical protein
MIYIDMENVVIGAQYTTTGQQQTGCQGLYGQGFVGGTTDGPNTA